MPDKYYFYQYQVGNLVSNNTDQSCLHGISKHISPNLLTRKKEIDTVKFLRATCPVVMEQHIEKTRLYIDAVKKKDLEKIGMYAIY